MARRRFHPATKAEPGNLKALKHGASSEHMLAPLREWHDAQLREDYPQMDDRVRAIGLPVWSGGPEMLYQIGTPRVIDRRGDRPPTSV